jgi:hypothetical protein
MVIRLDRGALVMDLPATLVLVDSDSEGQTCYRAQAVPMYATERGASGTPVLLVWGERRYRLVETDAADSEWTRSREDAASDGRA